MKSLSKTNIRVLKTQKSGFLTRVFNRLWKTPKGLDFIVKKRTSQQLSVRVFWVMKTETEAVENSRKRMLEEWKIES